MSKKRLSHRKRKKVIRNFIALIFILLLAFIGYSVISNMEKKGSNEVKPEHENYALYSELENTDTLNYLNKIEMNDNIDVLRLSEIFFKNDAFWPYIIKSNSDIENPLFITKGSIIRIPRIDPVLLDVNNPQSMRRAKLMGDSILNANLQDHQKAD